MSENTKLWDMLGRTDPAHTKGFTRGGGFKGTAIKPIWSYKRMTEEFGPCGKGWGINPPMFNVQDCGEEKLVFCTASIWYETPEQVCYGVGGDKIIAKNKYGLATDDEAFKKAWTDAITNALKMIGVGADVHMGLFDDNKYVNAMKQEFAEEPEVVGIKNEPPRKENGKPQQGWREDGTKTSYALKNEGSWEKLKAELDSDLADCHTLVALESIKTIYRTKAIEQHWNKQFLAALLEEFQAHERSIMATMEADELAEVPLDTALRQSLKQHPINAG